MTTANQPLEQQPQTTPADVQVTPQPVETNQQVLPNEDDDAIVAAMRAAEAELGQNGNDQGQGTPAETQPNAVVEGQNVDTTTQNGTPAPENAGKADQVMIPKARLDEVLAERDQWKNTAQYQQGVMDAQTRMIQGGVAAPANPNGTQPANAQPANAQPAAPGFDNEIATKEAEKLKLADQYDAGDISYKEMQEKQIGLDREIRSLTDKRSEMRVAEATKQATQTSVQVLVEAEVNRAAVDMQAQNPYIMAIQGHTNAQGIWNMIDGEAARTLVAKGINPADGTAASRIAFLQEKSALAAKYGPALVGEIKPASAQNGSAQPQPATPQLSPMANARLAKLDVAQTQPPVATMGSSGISTDVTDEQVMRMSQDEIADLAARNPAFARKFTGM